MSGLVDINEWEYFEPAFPVEVDDGRGTIFTHSCISARDYFAAQAMIGLMGYYGRIGHTSELLKPEIAEEAYETADAMLAERSKKP